MDPWPPPQQTPQNAPPPLTPLPPQALPVYPYADPMTYALRPRPPRVWTVFVAFKVAMLGGLILPAFVMVPIALARFGPAAFEGGMSDDKLAVVLGDPVVFLPTIASTQVVLVAVSLAGAMLSPVPWQKRLRLERPRLPWYGLLVVVVGTLALGLAGSLLIELLGVGDKGTLKMFQDALGGLRGPTLVAAALVIGLAPGFGEEMLFRGYTQTRLTRRWGARVSILVTSLLFALIHFDLVQGSFVLLLGFYLGAVTERAGSIWPAIVCHTVNNSLSTLAAPLEAEGVAVVPPGMSIAVIVACVAVLGACVWYVLRQPLVPVEEPVAEPFAGAAAPPMLPVAPMGYGAPPSVMPPSAPPGDDA